MDSWRLVDSGILDAAQNMALDRILLNSRASGECKNTIRFLRFARPVVLVGYNQSVEQEARVDFCMENGIEINRRITGGGTIFFDHSQIGWEIICDRSSLNMGMTSVDFFERASKPIINALNEMGIKAAFRPRNDIEVDGRKISGTGGTEEGDSLLFQGTLLVDFDVETMLKALRLPVEKLKHKELASAKDRVTCLKSELGGVPTYDEIKRNLTGHFEKAFDMTLEETGLSEKELADLNSAKIFFKSADWIHKIRLPKNDRDIVHVFNKTEGGIMRAAISVNAKKGRIASVMFTGDFFAQPGRLIMDLESQLKDIRADREIIRNRIVWFFDHYNGHVAGVGADDFAELMARCIDKMEYTKHGIPLAMVNHINTVNDTFENIIEGGVKNLLLPYCAKSESCGWRYKEGCSVCGDCPVGTAYEMGKERGMEIVTIQNFEHLMKTLATLKSCGASSFIGCCCEAFYIKHLEDFRGAELPGILLDIDSTTCYDLGKVRDAYGGKFERQTEINLELLRCVLDTDL